MSTMLKQSTAVDIAVGPFLDSTDGNTAETALTITQPDIRLKKNGGAWAQKSAAQTLTHEEAGWYECSLSTTDTDTLGELVVAIHESGALPVWRIFQIVPAAVYDATVSGTGAGIRADLGSMTELSSVPGVTGTIKDALQFLFLLARNKMTQTATTTLLRNDADAATIATSTVSDDGTTFIRGEFS